MAGIILVTGAAGKTGRAIITALLARNRSVRALVYREEQAQPLKSVGVDQVKVGDMRSDATIRDAVRGVEAIYHICPNVDPDELSIGRTIISNARASGIRHFVFHSVLHPQVELMPHHWLKLRVEEALLESNLPFTVLQPAAYMQNVLSQLEEMVERGIYSVPYSPEAPMSLVDLDDVAQAAATVLCEPGHVGSIYELAGPEVLTPREIAAAIGNRLGRDVRAEQTSIENWRRQAEGSGLGRYRIETLAKMFHYYDRYGLWANSRILRNLIGRSPTTFHEFIERTLRERQSQNKILRSKEL
ncbi:MAG: NmrA family NAD(P)-binding protein [Candidatus Bathyarchaeia archaeon]